MIRRVLWVFFFVFFLIFPCWAFNLNEFEVIAGFNNLSYDPDRKEAHVENEEFDAFLFTYGDIRLKFGINDNLGLDFNLSRDTILLNSVYTGLRMNTEFVNVEFGPFIGLNDDFDEPIIGISGGIEFAVPGIIFFSLNGSSSVGTQLEFTGDDVREHGKAKIGFWLPHVIPAFSAEYKNYYTDVNKQARNDEFFRFMFSADIFAKNFPAVFIVNGGYDILRRTYNIPGGRVKDEIGAIFAGGQIRWQVTHPLRLTAGFEIPFVYYTKGHMKTPQGLFNVFAGLAWTFF